MSDLVLGIDLGTTNSVVAVAEGGTVRVLTDEAGNRLIPSVVSFHPDGRILVGEEARDRRLVDAANTVYSIKRLIGRPYRSPEVQRAQERFAFRLRESANGGVLVVVREESYTLTEISAFVLREIRRIAEQALGRPCTRAVITVPAAFNELQRSATKAAGRVAGLEVLRILNEPTAAALAYGMANEGAQRVAVYDLGGGTFDLTLLELEKDVFEVTATAGDSFLGGDDIDLAIAERMAERFATQHRYDLRQDEQAFERLRAAAEWAKCRLSQLEKVEVTVEELAYGANGQSLDLDFAMTRGELEDLARPILTRSLDVCSRALRDAGIVAKDVQGTIMVGGSTRMPLVRQMARELFGREPRVDIDPDLVVAQGAALHGFALADAAGKKAAATAVKVPIPAPSFSAKQQAERARRELARATAPKQPAFAPNELDDPVQALAVPARGAVPPVAAGARSAAMGGPAALAKALGLGAANAPKKPAAPGFGDRISLDPAFGEAPSPPPAPRDSLDLGSLDDLGPVKAPGVLGLDAAFDDPREPGKGPNAAAPKPAAFGAKPVPMPFEARPGATPPSPFDDEPVEELEILDDVEGLELEGSIPPKKSSSDRASIEIAPDYAADVARHSLPPGAGMELDLESLSARGSAMELDLDDASAELELAPALPPGPAVAVAPMRAVGVGAPHAAAPVPSASPVAVAPTVVQLGTSPPPLLMDVTPLSLGLETVNGYCQHVVRRNVPIPCEQTKTFTTAVDNQTSVTVRVCQGESRVMSENQPLGELVLTNLRSAPRGRVRIEVTFQIDASGTLDVRAVDLDTGTAQTTRIDLLGAASDDEVDAMRRRQEQRLAGAR